METNETVQQMNLLEGSTGTPHMIQNLNRSSNQVSMDTTPKNTSSPMENDIVPHQSHFTSPTLALDQPKVLKNITLKLDNRELKRIEEENQRKKQQPEDDYDEPDDDEAYNDEESNYSQEDDEYVASGDEISDEEDDLSQEIYEEEKKVIPVSKFVLESGKIVQQKVKKRRRFSDEYDLTSDFIQEANIIDNIGNKYIDNDEKLALKLSNQRVSLRSKKKINYAEFEHSKLDEDLEEEPIENLDEYGDEIEPRGESEDKLSQIEKILAYREEKVTQDESGESPKKHKYEQSGTGKYEYLVKFRDLCYLKCEWIPQDVIEQGRLGKQRLQRFHNKRPELDPDPPFDPEYVEIDRVLARKHVDGVDYFLVKWQGLPYNECTWESSEIVNDPEVIAAFEKINTVPEKIDDNNKSYRPPLHQFQKLETVEFTNDNQLRNYQVEGVNWLRYCWYSRRNSILADEMGLGKTIQSVSILWYLQHYQNIRGPFLVIAPLSTIPHWRREFESWTSMNCVVYHGNSAARDIIRNYEWHFQDENGNVIHKSIYKFNVVVTTYEMILTDTEIFQPIRWKYVVIDEAHRLKNKSSRVLNEFLGFKYDHLLLLTGTPIQNNTQELWTLLNLLDYQAFPDVDIFMRDFGNLKDANQVATLHSILKPYLLRRMKEDVEKSIAPKEETIIEVELTTIQKKYYKAILERNFQHLNAGRTRAALPSLLNVMMQLRKCCNHPFLLKGVEDAELEILGSHSRESNETLIESSGKLVLIDKLLPRLKEEGHKILIFSQMVRVLDILEDYMNYRSYKYERLDGGIRGPERQASIDRFSRDKDIFVFLLCTRAGGVGINLTAADTVIIFDSDWNPQNDLQAQARCHRIGQEKAVKVYRLLTRNTYERNMFERASQKLGLDQVVLNRSSEDGESKPKFSSQEVDSLLKYGVYDLFRDDDTVSEKFREENIEDIFARRTTRIVHDQNKAGSSFSKASFSSNDANNDLDMNDPDFWKKVMPEMADRPDPNIIYMPRQRKQVFRANQSEGEEYYDTEHGFEQDDYRGARSRRKSTAKSAWNMTQRNRFIRALTLLGFGRWRDIKRHAKLTHKTLKDIALYGRAYLRKVIAYANNEEGEDVLMKRITNCKDREEDLYEDGDEIIDFKNLESEITSLEKDDVLLNETRFLEGVKSGATQTIKRFELLVEVGDLVRSEFKDFKNFPVIDGGNFFESWWGVKEDKDLLIGTHKWGFGQYEKMMADPTLCYYSQVSHKVAAKSTGSTKPKKDDDEEDEEDEMMDMEDDENISEKVTAEKNNETSGPLRDMPASKLLTHRVKHLLKAFENMRRKKQLQEAREKKRHSSTASKRRSQKKKRTSSGD